MRVNLPHLLHVAAALIDRTSWLVVAPLRILLIVVLALTARWLTHRAIRRLTRSTAQGTAPTLLRPLKERSPSLLREAAGLLTERRRQRAETIGSVLRNVSSIATFTVATMLILAELRVDLAPLLASAGIAAVALGFGAQYLVRDVISGLFMIIEDQYGVGDTVDLGETVGTVEVVGLRVTTIRDIRGVVWYVRNGEVLRVGNHSQGWARVVIDVPIGLGTDVDQATSLIRAAADRVAAEPELTGQIIEPPEVWGVEDVTLDGPVVRVTMKTNSDEQWTIGRRLRRAVVESLNEAGIAAQISGSRMYVRPRPQEGDAG
ncbi:MAG: mechanosensitive ion channel [Micromonosporaceae bacterium]|nr:mechanosensitive ion channel [Micromonosporaceae bacterium]